MNALFRSSHLIAAATLGVSTATYVGIRAKWGIKKQLPYDEESGQALHTFEIVKKTPSEHVADYATFVFAAGVLFTTLRIAVGKVSTGTYQPLARGLALTSARGLAQKMGIKDIRYCKAPDGDGNEGCVDSLFSSIELPELYLSPSSSKAVIAHELVHIQRTHSACKDLFTASLIPSAWAFLEHFGDTDGGVTAGLVSLYALRHLYCRYTEREADLMACDLVDSDEIEKLIAYLEKLKNEQTPALPFTALLNDHPNVETRIRYLNEELRRRRA